MPDTTIRQPFRKGHLGKLIWEHDASAILRLTIFFEQNLKCWGPGESFPYHHTFQVSNTKLWYWESLSPTNSQTFGTLESTAYSLKCWR